MCVPASCPMCRERAALGLQVLFPKPADGGDFGSDGSDGGEVSHHPHPTTLLVHLCRQVCPGGFGLHIWPRRDHMLMALANRDGSFTGTIYMDSQARLGVGLGARNPWTRRPRRLTGTPLTCTHQGDEDSFAALEADEAACRRAR